jgi:hypothetical protein
MSDIKNIKEMLTTMSGFGSITKGDILDLINTIESQKEEIEKLLAERTENEIIIKRKLKIKQDAIDESMTRIESLKAITEQINQDSKEANDHYREVARGLWAGNDCPDIDQIASKFKELSAITELAVKGLKSILASSDGCVKRDLKIYAQLAIWEIERLQNAQT